MIDSDSELKEFVITDEEWIHYESINNLLAPFEEANVWASGSNYPTIQTVILIYDELMESKEIQTTSESKK